MYSWGRLMCAESPTLHREALTLRDAFKHEGFKGSRRAVREEWDDPGRSCHLQVFDGKSLVAAARITEFDDNRLSDGTENPVADIINKWTGFLLPTAGRRLVISRVVVREGADGCGRCYRGSCINERLFLAALERGCATGVPVYCVVKRDLTRQIEKLRRMGFRVIGDAVSEDIPGQKVPVVVMENFPHATQNLWSIRLRETTKVIEEAFPVGSTDKKKAGRNPVSGTTVAPIRVH